MSIELQIVRYQYRWYDNNPNTVTYGVWYEWKDTTKKQYENLIADNNPLYEVRRLYTEAKNYLIQCASCENCHDDVGKPWAYDHSSWCRERHTEPLGPCIDYIKDQANLIPIVSLYDV